MSSNLQDKFKILDFTQNSDLNEQIIRNSSLLIEPKTFTDSIDFDQLFEDISLSNIASGVFGSGVSGQGIELGVSGTTGYLQSKNYVLGTTGWRIDSTGDAQLNSLTLTGGTIKYGKTSFTDSTNAGYNISSAGFYFGSASDASYVKYNIGTGTFGIKASITGSTIDATSTIGGRTASILATAIDTSGHFADSAISTASGTILGQFTFSGSGALQIGTYVNGVTGDLKISPTGILGRDKDNNTTFSINATTGVAVLNGLVVGTNVGLGTAQDSAGVTTIVGNVVTTGFVNALSVVAGSVAAEDITGTTITGKTLQTAASGQRIVVSSDNTITTYSANGATGTIYGGTVGGKEVLYVGATVSAGDLFLSTGSTGRIIFARGSTLLHYMDGDGLTFGWVGSYIISGSDSIFRFNAGSVEVFKDFVSYDAGVVNLGTAGQYFNDVSYKTLTDRGCLGLFDEGVELQNGEKVSDLEALKSIKKHPTLETTYGVPRFDYKTMPKAVYKIADKDGVPLPRDEKDRPYFIDEETKEKKYAEDGAELTALVSIMLGAIKELDKRIEKLEK